MDRDIVLLIDLARDVQPVVQSSRHAGGDGFLAVNFIPQFDEYDAAPASGETVFVLDCSGSMQGESITQAIIALSLCLRSLSEGDTFNICRFGSTWELLSPEPLVYGEETLQRALMWINRPADLGGTELLGPLSSILAMPPITGSLRQIILLTDGQVSNEAVIIALARQHREHNRIFSFGIGSACSTTLVKGLARASGGAAEFITAGERIDDKVLRTFSRVGSPAATDIRVDWDGADVRTLAQLPPVFDGDILSVFGRVRGRVPSQVTLSCNTPAGPKQWSVPVPPPCADDDAIATMWARRVIQSLEDVNELSRPLSADSPAGRDAAAMIGISREFNILSPLTTFIAIEHRSLKDRNEGQPELRRVPVLLAAGWGQLEAACAPPMAAMAPMLMASASFGAMPLATPPPNQGESRGMLSRMFRRAAKSVAPAGAKEQAAAALPGDTAVLISLQSAKGYFDWNASADKVLRAHHARYDDLATKITAELSRAGITVDSQQRPQAVATCIVLLLLRRYLSQDEPLWRRAARKAITWLLTVTHLSGGDMEKLLKDLEKILP